MIGTSAATSGTVRARWFFSVSTYSAPPPSLAEHRATQPQARAGHRYLVADLETSQFAPAQPGQSQDWRDVGVRARAGRRERVQLGQGRRSAPSRLTRPLVG